MRRWGQQQERLQGPQPRGMRRLLNLRIPKLRTGRFFLEDVLERYQRLDRALVAAATEMYAAGHWQLRRRVGHRRGHVLRGEMLEGAARGMQGCPRRGARRTRVP